MRSDWTIASLGELCLVTAGGTPSRATPAYWDGDVPWVKISDMLQGVITSTDEKISRVGLENSPAKLLPRGTLLLSIFATIGRTAVLGIDATTNQAIVGLCVRDKSRLDERFLKRFLEFKSAELEGRARGVAQANINGAILKSLSVPLPPLPEQRRIAEVLDRAEALRAKRRAALAQLDTLTQSIFVDMFGDPATNPKGWPTTRLGDVCTRVTDGTHQPPRWSPSGNPFLFVSNVVNGEITFDTQKYISDETHAELTRRCPIDVGDVLYSTVGSYGVPAIVRTTRKFAFQRHIAHLKPDRNVLDPEFLCGMLASPPLKRQADRAARGVAQKTVNLADIREFQVVCPSLTVQRDFSRRRGAIEQLRSAHRASLAELEALFASLRHRAFRGEL